MVSNFLRLVLVTSMSLGISIAKAEVVYDNVTKRWLSASMCVENMAFHFFLEKDQPAAKAVIDALNTCSDEIDNYSMVVNSVLKENNINQPHQQEKVRLYIEGRLHEIAYRSITGELR